MRFARIQRPTACLLASDWAIDAVQAAAQKFDKWHPEGDPKHVWIASNDLLTSAIPAMENGYIDVSVTWDAKSHAKEAVRVMFDILQRQGSAVRTEWLSGERLARDARDGQGHDRLLGSKIQVTVFSGGGGFSPSPFFRELVDDASA